MNLIRLNCCGDRPWGCLVFHRTLNNFLRKSTYHTQHQLSPNGRATGRDRTPIPHALPFGSPKNNQIPAQRKCYRVSMARRRDHVGFDGRRLSLRKHHWHACQWIRKNKATRLVGSVAVHQVGESFTRCRPCKGAKNASVDVLSDVRIRRGTTGLKAQAAVWLAKMPSFCSFWASRTLSQKNS